MGYGELVNSHRPFPGGLGSLLSSAWRERRLIHQLIRREVLGRYQGSMAGLLWSLLHPLLMLLVYTFVFSVVFEAKWPGVMGGEGRLRFALLLFMGVTCHGLLAEVITRAPTLVIGNANYVKKVVFPLESLGFTLVGSAAFHAMISLLILLVAKALWDGGLPVTALWLPVVLMPLVLMALGFAWLFAALGVFLRDLQQVSGLLATLMMFLAPVFYPATALPEPYRAWLYANPITVPVEQARTVLFAGMAPDAPLVATYWLVALVVMCFGFWWFQRSRRGFADVL